MALVRILDDYYMIFPSHGEANKDATFMCICLGPYCLEGYIEWSLCYQFSMATNMFGLPVSGLVSIAVEIYFVYLYFILLLEIMEGSHFGRYSHSNEDWVSVRFMM